MRILTLKTRTAANIKIPGYPKYTIKFKYYFQWSFWTLQEKQVGRDTGSDNPLPFIKGEGSAEAPG